MADDIVSAPRRPRRGTVVLRVAVGVVGATVGAGIVVLTAAVAHCGAFGGTCPPPEGLHGDVYGGIGAGLTLAVAAPVLAWRPDRRGVVLALGVVAVVVAPVTYALGTAAVRG